MIGLYKYIESPFGEKTYFAGANSGVGFVKLFGDFYEESSLDRLYIIKSVPPMQGRVPSIFCAAPIPLRSMP